MARGRQVMARRPSRHPPDFEGPVQGSGGEETRIIGIQLVHHGVMDMALKARNRGPTRLSDGHVIRGREKVGHDQVHAEV